LASAGYEDAEVLIGRIAFEAGKTDALVAFYEQRNRYDDLLAVLRALAERSADPHARAELYLRCARLLVGTLGDPLRRDRGVPRSTGRRRERRGLALSASRAQDIDDPAELAEVLRRLAALIEAPEQRRDLVFERAILLPTGSSGARKPRRCCATS